MSESQARPDEGQTPIFVSAFLRHLAGEGGREADFSGVRSIDRFGAPWIDRFARAFGGAKECQRVVVYAPNSFMKRRFGEKIVAGLARWDLTHVIDMSGAYIPGQAMPTVVLVGRAAPPLSSFVRCLVGIRGEPMRPKDPERGFVWASVLRHYDRPGCGDEWTRCADVPRERLAVHPWDLE